MRSSSHCPDAPGRGASCVELTAGHRTEHAEGCFLRRLNFSEYLICVGRSGCGGGMHRCCVLVGIGFGIGVNDACDAGNDLRRGQILGIGKYDSCPVFEQIREGFLPRRIAEVVTQAGVVDIVFLHECFIGDQRCLRDYFIDAS